MAEWLAGPIREPVKEGAELPIVAERESGAEDVLALAGAFGEVRAVAGIGAMAMGRLGDPHLVGFGAARDVHDLG